MLKPNTMKFMRVVSSELFISRRLFSNTAHGQRKQFRAYALSASIGCVGGIGLATAVAFSNANKNHPVRDIKLPTFLANCAPPPGLGLVDALKLTNVPPTDPDDKKRHEFKWTAAGEAVGIATANSISIAENRSFEEWNTAAAKLFGQEYGKIKIHHVLLKEYDDIQREINFGRLILVSQDHLDWLWLPRKIGIATFVYDEQVDSYRVYVYENFVALELGSNARGNMNIPLSIKFLHDFKNPMNATPNHPSVTEIVEKFDADFEIWRQKCAYIY